MNNDVYPKTRKEAQASDSKVYFTGKPCPHGHLSLRRTVNSACTECVSLNNKLKWAAGAVKPSKNRKATNEKWNASSKGVSAKQRWKEKDPKRAWAVSARGGCKARAAQRGVDFNLSFEYILNLTPDSCPVFGTKFIFIGQKTCPESATVDRVDPKKGYVEGNIAIISMKANMIKNAYKSEDIFKVANWLKNLGY